MALPAAVVAGAKLLAPIVIDYGLKKLREAHNNAQTSYEDETGAELSDTQASAAHLKANEELVTAGVPSETEMTEDEKRQLIEQGAKLDVLMENDQIQWEGKDADREALMEARSGLVEAKAEYRNAVEAAMENYAADKPAAEQPKVK